MKRLGYRYHTYGFYYAAQRWGLRGRWDLLQIDNSERAFKIVIFSKLSVDSLPLWSRFWKFWTNHLKSRPLLNHVPVHETHSAKVRRIKTTSKTPSLNRIVRLRALTLHSNVEVLGLRLYCLGFRRKSIGLGLLTGARLQV